MVNQLHFNLKKKRKWVYRYVFESLISVNGCIPGHRTGKGQFSFQSQRKAMPKNAQTTAQLHSFHTLVK